MKQRTLWSAVLVAGLALAGCGSASDPDSASGGRAASSSSGTGSPATPPRPRYVEKAKADFAKKHPGVTVEFVAQPFDQYYTLLGAAIQAGKGPDVMLFNGGGQIRDRADSLLPLDDYVGRGQAAAGRLGGLHQGRQDLRRPGDPAGPPDLLQQGALPEGRARPGEARHDLGRVRRQLRGHHQGDRRQVLRAGQQGRHRHPVLPLRPRLGHPLAAGVRRLDRRQARLDLAGRQAGLRALERGQRQGPEQRRGQLDRDVQRRVRGLPVRQGRPRHRPDVRHRALEGLRRVPRRRERRRHDVAGRHRRRHAEPSLRRRHRLRGREVDQGPEGRRRPGALADLDRRAEGVLRRRGRDRLRHHDRRLERRPGRRHDRVARSRPASPPCTSPCRPRRWT